MGNKKSKLEKLNIQNAFTFNEYEKLDVSGLMKVEGGADNDEDQCILKECILSSGSDTCYTGA